LTEKHYLSRDECLSKLFQLRYGHLTTCPDCKRTTTFHRVAGRRCFECRNCGYQLYPTVGTIFEKTRTDLAKWCGALSLICSATDGITAKKISRELNISYLTARKITKQINRFLSADQADIGPPLIEVCNSCLPDALRLELGFASRGPDEPIRIWDPRLFCKILQI
jgi:transposase